MTLGQKVIDLVTHGEPNYIVSGKPYTRLLRTYYIKANSEYSVVIAMKSRQIYLYIDKGFIPNGYDNIITSLSLCSRGLGHFSLRSKQV